MANVERSLLRSAIAGCAALGLLTASACSTGDDSSRLAAGGAGGAAPAAGGAAGSPNTAFLMRAIPDQQHLDVTETCADGTREGKRCIPDRVLARRGVCYSGYRSNQSPNAFTYPSEAEIKEDLELLLRAGYSFLRIFDAGPHASTLLKVITDNAFDVKVQQGVWIKGSKALQDSANQIEIERGIALAKQYPNVIVGVSIGNETLDTWSSVLTDPADLAAYIGQVREGITQPVTTDDLYPPFQLVGGYENVIQVLKAVDYVSVHVYAHIDASFASWDYQQPIVPAGQARVDAMMKAALDYTKINITHVRGAMKANQLDLPIIVGEAGWKSRVTDRTKVAEGVFAHEVNQQLFFDELEDWVYGAGRDTSSPSSVFYFEAFDETWKGADDGWGLFDTRRTAKYVMWSKFPELTPPGATPYTAADAQYYK